PPRGIAAADAGAAPRAAGGRRTDRAGAPSDRPHAPHPARRLVSCPRSSLSHRGRRCALPARRDDEVVSRRYVEEEQRSRAGCSAVRMPTNFWDRTVGGPSNQGAKAMRRVATRLAAFILTKYTPGST